MKSNLYFSIIFFSLLNGVMAQINLVPNPSFEFTTGCPGGPGLWGACSSWNNVNMNNGMGPWGTPDFFHSCGSGSTAPPATFAGTCSPNTGNAMMAIVVYNAPYPDYREYIATPLTCTLNPGTTYTLSFWLTNGSGIKSPWTVKNIGVHFSNGPLSQSGWSLINVVPQCEITSNVISTTWQQFTFTVNPTSAWNYMTIGCFRTDALNNPLTSFPNPGGPFSVYSNYYIDDVHLYSPGTPPASSVTIQSNSGSFAVCQGNSLTLWATGVLNYTWTGYTTQSITITPTLNTTYTLNYIGTGPCNTSPTLLSLTKAITVLPKPVLTVSGPSTLCPGSTASLTVSGASSYTWSNFSNSNQIVVSPTTNTVYTVLGTAANGCTSSASSSVNVAGVLISVVGNSSICAGGTAILMTSGANSYTWSNGQTGSTIFVSPTVSTVYSVSGTGNICNSNTSSVTVNVVSPPAILITGNTLVCLRQPVLLQASGASSYTWSSGSTGSVTTFTTLTSGVYSVTGTSGLPGCRSTGTVFVTVSECLGIEKFEQGRITVFPNPTKSELFVQVPNTGILEMNLTDCFGRVILKQMEPNSRIVVLNLFDLDAGVYFLTIISQGRTQSIKVLKE